jgi:hypothetical protein
MRHAEEASELLLERFDFAGQDVAGAPNHPCNRRIDRNAVACHAQSRGGLWYDGGRYSFRTLRSGRCHWVRSIDPGKRTSLYTREAQTSTIASSENLSIDSHTPSGIRTP